ncbi:LIM and calponin homology domains-containing protein 1-like isoform X2 [Polypterus senegalus]|uniref:LIM and calponin homology domains-containing protein 1-like isoform X2 n=1 Tax=Polypterus senegalus TaxID=55291 RepID=UPI0019665C1E|nr:LIM and calponin homology domains-containing protein 1-like isoform X2 [Polypterus senegalus]
MASPGLDLEESRQQDASPEPAFHEAQQWIEAVTGRRFGEKDFRGGLENGILLCELLNAIKPGIIKKINRLPTPIAGLDNITLFLRGCEDLGLKGSQLFDPGDLQDTSTRANLKSPDCSRKLKNVLITIYWLGKAANCCASYNGPTLNLKEFEGLLSLIRKEAEDLESPKRSIRDSGYVDCWDSERSDSLSPPRHGRDDSFDSLDSFGSRSQQTPSPDVVIRGSSDGRGSDSESDVPHRKMPDVRKDDMLTRRTSCSEPRAAMPFNQYLPNKSNQSAYVPAPLRKKKTEREEYRKSWSTATSPIGGERPFSSQPETINEEEHEEHLLNGRDDTMQKDCHLTQTISVQSERITGNHYNINKVNERQTLRLEGKDKEEETEEEKKLKRLARAGIKVLPASVRYSSSQETSKEKKAAAASVILSQDNDFLRNESQHGLDSEEEEDEQRFPDVEKDDFALRKAKMNQFKPKLSPNQFIPSPTASKEKEAAKDMKRDLHHSRVCVQDKPWQHCSSRCADSNSKALLIETNEVLMKRDSQIIPSTLNDEENNVEKGSQRVLLNLKKDDLARMRVQSGPVQSAEPRSFVKPSITLSDLQKQQRLMLFPESSEGQTELGNPPQILTRRINQFYKSMQEDSKEEDEEDGEKVTLPNVQKDDLAKRRAQSHSFVTREPQPFLKTSFTQSDLEKWHRLKLSSETSEETSNLFCQTLDKDGPAVQAKAAALDDLASQKTNRATKKATGSRQRFVHFGPVTEIDQKSWEKVSIPKTTSEGEATEHVTNIVHVSSSDASSKTRDSDLKHLRQISSEINRESSVPVNPDGLCRSPLVMRDKHATCEADWHLQEDSDEEEEERLPNLEKDDMLARRTGTFQKQNMNPVFNKFLPMPASLRSRQDAHSKKSQQPEDSPRVITRNSCGSESLESTTSPGNEVQIVSPVNIQSTEFEEDSDEETREGRLPDLEKDDMLARRTGAFQRMPCYTFNQFLPVPGSLQKNQGVDLEKSNSSSGLSEPVDQCRQIAMPTVGVRPKEIRAPTKVPLHENKEKEGKEPLSDMEKHDVNSLAPASPKRTSLVVSQAFSVSASPPVQTLKDDKPRRRPSWLDDDLPPIYSHRASVSDDPESVSMIDMRYDEEAILQPHSKARHEHLHNLHNLLREEEDKWQDDLARWKNRRRSASQDLIKKEEERKMMERLMSGEQNLSERRRSIKTYKEIVEEKERRERELHEAYRNAKSPEEAEAVLRRYTQRFTISEAVLEKLEIPKILERSLSVDSDTSPKKEPSAMKYLRQQSLPAPKFTATVQATVEGAPLSQTSPQVSPTRIVSSKAVPLLTPKPYSQPRSSQSGLKSLKVDGMMRVNGEAGNVFERAANENESKPLSTSTSTTKKLIIESLARTDPSSNKSLEAPKGCTSYGTEQNSIMSSTSAVKLHTENFQVKSSVRTKTNILQDTAKINASLEKGETSEDESMGKYHEDFVGPKTTELKTLSCSSDSYRDDDVFEDEAIPSSTEEDMQRTPQRDAHSLVCPVADISSTIMRKDCSQLNSFQNNMYCLSMKEKNQDTAVHDNIQKPVKLAACVIREHKPQQLESLASLETQTAEIIGELSSSGSVPRRCSNSWLRWEFFTQSATDDDNSDILESPINLAKRNEHWSWDPEEERRRQERWQQEQERLLQEKYKKEQEKLKQEWEKAQKEVEEEGRRYHEEERKILEETVTPLTPRSSTLSSPSRSDQPQLPLDPDGTIVRSLADWERKQELLEMQAREKAETCQKNANMQENAHKIFFSSNQETIGKSDAFLKETDSLHTQNIINTNTVVYSPQNCKRPLTDHSQQATSELHFTHDGSWNNKQPLIKEEDDLWKKTASLDRNWNPQSVMDGMKRSGSYENIASNPSKSSPCSSNLQNQSPNSRSVSGKKLCSSCGHPLGKGAAMIIETLSLYFHIHCFKCGICKGQLGDTTTGTDVRIRNGLLNCQDCYIRSRTTGQPTTL